MEGKKAGAALVLFLCTTCLLWWAATSCDTENEVLSPAYSNAASSYLVVVRHSVENDSHVYRGSISTTACHALSTGVETEGVNPTELRITLTRIEAPTCPYDISSIDTEEPFTIVVEGREEPQVKSLSIDGERIAFSVIEE